MLRPSNQLIIFSSKRIQVGGENIYQFITESLFLLIVPLFLYISLRDYTIDYIRNKMRTYNLKGVFIHSNVVYIVEYLKRLIFRTQRSTSITTSMSMQFHTLYATLDHVVVGSTEMTKPCGAHLQRSPLALWTNMDSERRKRPYHKYL